MQQQPPAEMMHVSIDDPLQIDDHDDVADVDAAAAVALVPQPMQPIAVVDDAAAAVVVLAAAPTHHQQPLSFRDAVKKIRFLTLTPKQFAENVARSNILTQPEAFAILMNISSPTHDIYPMPAGFSTSTKSRAYVEQTPCAVAPVAPIERAGSAGVAGVASTSSASSSSSSLQHNNSSNTNDGRPKRLQPFHGFREEDVMLIERDRMLGLPSGSRDRDPMQRDRDRDLMGRLGGGGGSGGDAANGLSGGGGGSSGNMMETRKFYCVRTIRQQIDYFNSSVTDCSLTFTVDRSICITGIQVPTQVLGEQSMHTGIPERYSELLYAHLLDSQGARLTYTHCTSRVRYDSLMEISFDRPVFIQRNKVYKVGVAFNKLGWYPMCSCVPLITCETVCFTFNVGPANESVRDGLIRAIVFSQARDLFN